jgi:1-acyl-sn-glycerol-3-phosphate acyltransferase
MARGHDHARGGGKKPMIRAAFVTLVTFAYILVLGPPLLLYALLTGNTDPIYNIGCMGARMAVRLAGVRLDVQGLEKIPRDRAVVFMANHQSNCDPPALLAVLPAVWILVKKEFFRVPILGRVMLARGYIPVDRKHRERAIAAVQEAVNALKAGRSFLVFPEGTRSPDGRLQRLKKGAFVMAIEAGAPVVPVSISGSGKIMPKGEFVMRPGRVRITIHAPIPTAGMTVEQRQVVMDRVRHAILSGLDKEEWPLDTAGESSTGPASPPAATSP